jgi:hypothetical protein
MPKYRNTPREVNGEKYRSKREMDRHQALLLLQKKGWISQLRREVPYVLAPAVKIAGRTKPALRYFADFVYVRNDPKPGPSNPLGMPVEVVEDCKGVRTQVYRIKQHLMATVHGIEICET